MNGRAAILLAAAGLSGGRVFRCVCRAGKHRGQGVTERLVWHVVKQYAAKLGFTGVAPHDLRRSCAKLCHSAGGELDQIQFLLGHASVQAMQSSLRTHLRQELSIHVAAAEPSPSLPLGLIKRH